MSVLAVDASPVAIEAAARAADMQGVGDRCRFLVHDLDHGLPAGDPVDVIHCHRFRDPRLYSSMIERIRHGGLIAISVLSEIGGSSGKFRAVSGELLDAFSLEKPGASTAADPAQVQHPLEVLHHLEADGVATLVARKNAPLR